MTPVPAYVEHAFMPDSDLPPGLYLTMPQGHALLSGPVQATVAGPVAHRRLAILDMGATVQIGGIDVTDPEVVGRLADHLKTLSYRMARERVHPYRPGTPESRRRDEAARAGEMWDRNGRPITPGRAVAVYDAGTGQLLGQTRVALVDTAAGVAFVHITINVGGDTVGQLASPVVFPEDVEVVEDPVPSG